MPNYAPKTDLKKTAGVDTSDFAKKIVDLANLKSDVGKLDIDKLKNFDCMQNQGKMFLNTENVLLS